MATARRRSAAKPAPKRRSRPKKAPAAAAATKQVGADSAIDSSISPQASPEPSSPPAGETPGLGLVGRQFERADEKQRAATAADLSNDKFAPPPPEPFAWTPDKAESVVRVFGHIAGAIDPLASSEFADDLWKADEQDCREIAAPLSRILNRHATARQLAGYSDEAELLAAGYGYVRKNSAKRGRIKMQEKRATEAANDAHRSMYAAEPAPMTPMPAAPPAVVPTAPAPLVEPSPEPPPHLAPVHVVDARDIVLVPDGPETFAIVRDGETAGDFDGIAPAGMSGDDLGMFGATVNTRQGFMPDLPPDQYE